MNGETIIRPFGGIKNSTSMEPLKDLKNAQEVNSESSSDETDSRYSDSSFDREEKLNKSKEQIIRVQEFSGYKSKNPESRFI